MGRTLVAGAMGFVLALAGGDAWAPRRLLAGVPPATTSPPSAAEAPRPIVQVLVLHNDSTLVGRIDRLEDSYRVRTDFGDTVVPAKSVARACNSLEEGYQFLRSRANLRDGQERLRLARWCLKQGLLEEARSEAAEAVRLLPRSAEARGLLSVVEKMHGEASAGGGKSPAAGNVGASDTGDAKRPLPSNRRPAFIDQRPPTVDAPSLQVFTQKIQPILSNTCSAASCHGGDKGGSFRFAKISGGYTASLTRDNLDRTLPWIDANDPMNSPLLRRALEAHGGAAKPPLAGRDAPAYQTLEAWVTALAPPRGLAAERLPEHDPDDRWPAGAPGRTESPPDRFATLPTSNPADSPPATAFNPGSQASGSVEPRPPTMPSTPSTATPMQSGNDPSATPIVLNPLRPGQPVPKPPKDSLGGGTTVAHAPLPGSGPAADALRGDKPPTPVKPPALPDAPPGQSVRPPAPAPAPAPADPFDPVIFNRQMHPDRK